jgi:3-hydroxyisobutyrate dehydrogenase-like beta-hydroxyacid dehydrogenase
MNERPVGTRLGFIGLGDQGRPMALTIARSGHPLTVFDVRDQAMVGFAELGANLATGATEVAEHSDIVAFCLRDEEQVRQLLTGEEGLLAAMTPGQLLVMHSTVSPRFAMMLAALAEERKIGFLDAPVSGSSVQARERGSLAVFVGGTQRDFEQGQPLLNAIGEHVELLGPVGSGEVGKLCNNLMLFCNTFATFEAARLAAAFGIPPETMVRMARHGSGRSWSLEEWGFWHRMMPNHPAGSREAMIKFLHKDLLLAIDAAKEVNVELPMGERAEAIAPDVIGGIWDDVSAAR